jgi:hypothetical protein
MEVKINLIENFKTVDSGLEGHYSKWSSQLKSAFQTPKTEKCDCSNDNSTTCCQSLTNGNHSTEVIKHIYIKFKLSSFILRKMAMMKN